MTIRLSIRFRKRVLPVLGVVLPTACLRLGYDYPNLAENGPINPAGGTSGRAGNSPIERDSGTGGSQPGVDNAPPVQDAAMAGTPSVVDAGSPANQVVDASPVDAGNTLSPWWDASFTQRRRIVLDNRLQAETLVDFPIAVRLGASDFNYALSQSAGEDLRFVGADGSTLLAHEIETWNAAGQSVVWVKIPSLPASSNAEFVWLYSGNLTVPDTQRPQAVWSNGYAAVWHLNSGAFDSTASANSGTPVGGMPSPGQTANGHNFNGVGQHIDVGAPSALANVFADGGSVSAWINATSYGGGNFGRILDKALTTDAGNGWEMHIDQAGTPQQSFRFEHDFSAHWGAWETGTDTIQLNRWYHVAVAFNSSSSANDPRLYIDGSNVLHQEREIPSGTVLDDSAVALWMGDHSGLGERNFTGTLDEIRVSSVLRTDAWIRAEYLASTGALTILAESSSIL